MSVLWQQRLVAPGEAFDAVADSYDDVFTQSVIGRAQRELVWNVLVGTFKLGERVLELNCGTGEDALFLGRLGVVVDACDSSARMLEVARKRKAAEAPDLPIGFRHLATEDIRDFRPTLPFDGVVSNFSGLNCVKDLARVASELSILVRRNGSLVLCLSNRICVWELVWFGMRGLFKKATRRLGGSAVAHVGNKEICVWYPTLRQIKRAFSPWFELRSVNAVGLFVPPSYLERWAREHAKTIAIGKHRLRRGALAVAARLGRPHSFAVRKGGWMALLKLMKNSAVEIPADQTSASEPARQLKISLKCPSCGEDIGAISYGAPLMLETGLRCANCSFLLANEQGIWKALPDERQIHYQQFLTEYQTVRAAEGRGSNKASFYLALPHKDLTGRNEWQWAIRARTFRCVEDVILPQLEKGHSRPLSILDLGAGNGWLSYRLALRGHRPVAVDLLTNQTDGLGAASHYLQELQVLFPRFQAELDRLPFRDAQFDCAIFNASFHYSENYYFTLGEAIRCLRPLGTIIIADSPFYRNEKGGLQMLEERRHTFNTRFGFPSNSLASLEYLTPERLLALEAGFGIRWQVIRPRYGVRWGMRPLFAWWNGKREPSQFQIYTAVVKTQ
jgi:SAM-dependent methyltransferase